MSIWPVQLAEWFPLGHDYHDIAVSITKMVRCCCCNKRVRFRLAVGHHSLPWGYGDLWCSWKCCNKNTKRIAKPDKRFWRRMKRRFKDIGDINVKI